MVPMVAMAIIGLYQLIQKPKEVWRDPALRLLGMLFLCIWLPMILSLTDAVYFPRSLYTVFSFVWYPLASIFVIWEMRKENAWDKLLIAIIFTMVFWSLDAMIQLLVGYDLVGYPLLRGNVTGLFYPELRLGYVLAVLSPLFFEVIRRYAVNYNRWAWLLIIPLILAILLNNRRVAWIMLVIAVATYLIYAYQMEFWKYRKKPLLVAGMMTALLIPALLSYTPFLQRVEKTSALFSGDYALMNAATSNRLPLWNTALAMAADHWLNGVGARGFRYICQKYSSGEKSPGDGPPVGCSTHPHQTLLEVSAETGLLGVIGYLLFGWFLWRHFQRLPSAERCRMMPWGIAILVAMLPLNAHLAFYGSYWSSFCWWLVSLTLAMSDQWMISGRSVRQ